MEKQRRRDARGIVGKIAAVVFAAGFVLSIVPAIRALAEGTIFKIQSAEITEISTGASGSINTYDEQTIVSNVTFHKINDSISYKIVLQNSDTKDYTIESITDDNASEQISYAYDIHAGKTIAAGADLDFLLTAKYVSSVTDTTKRATASNVKFFIKFAEKEEPEEIDIVVPNTDTETPVVPDTGANTKSDNGAGVSLATMIISVAGLTVLALIAVKKHKKYAKIIGVAVVAVSAFGLVTSARAANIETNSFTLTTSYGLYDKLVIKNGDKDVVIDYGEKLEDIDEITEPTKPGYTFDGWEDENGNPVDPTKPITEDITIKPKFTANTYTVKFDANGGNGAMADMQFTYDEAQVLTQNAFNFMGREYTGWDTKPNGSGVHYADKAEVKNLTTENNGVVTLYAQWSINPFHIDYDGNGATSGEMATTNCEYDEACELRDNAFEKYGYDFAGWKYNDTIYADKADVTNIIDHGTITMQAQWTPHVYTITYTGLTTEEAAALRTAGNPDNYTVETASFTLIKPADRKDADGDVRERCIGWRDVTVYEDVTLPISNALGDKTYEAVWQTVALEEFDITYDYDGGSVATANPTKLTKEQSANLNEPAKTGYTFTGWTGTTIEGSTPVKPYAIPAPHQKGNLAYTAHYRANNYTIAFDGNGATSGSTASTSMTYDEAKNLTANGFARTGYTFAGWKLGDINFANEQEVKNLTAEDGATVTLKAQWTPNTFTIIFHHTNNEVSNQDAMTPQAVTYDVTTTIKPNTYEREHYKFMGWATNATQAANANTRAKVNTAKVYDDEANITNAVTENNGELHLYAIWLERTSELNKGYEIWWGNFREALGNNDIVSFEEYTGDRDVSTIESRHNIALPSSNFPTYLWMETDEQGAKRAYWWSEAEHPKMNSDIRQMFDALPQIERIDLSGFIFPNATVMSGVFRGDTKLTTVVFPSEAPTIAAGTSMAQMFSGCKSLENLNMIKHWDFSNIAEMDSLFSGATSLKSLESIKDWNVSNVKSMSGMFKGSGIESVAPIKNWNVNNVEYMNQMFMGATKLTSVDLSNWHTSGNLKNIKEIFAGGIVDNPETTLEIDLSGWNTSNVIDTEIAFGNGRIAELDVSGWDMSSLVSGPFMFGIYANNIETIYYDGGSLPFDSEADTHGIFRGDAKLVGGAGSTSLDKELNVYARVDDPCSGKPGYFTWKDHQYICFNANYEGSTATAGQYVSTTAPDQLESNPLTRPGYVLVGWAETADGEKVYDNNGAITLTESVKSPKQLYAVWAESSSMLHAGLRGIADDINSLAGDDILDSFEKYNNGTPDIDNLDTVIVSTSDSYFPTYIWREGNKVYWWSEADKVYMNPVSGNMFYAVQVKNVSLVGLDSSKVTNLSRMFQGGIVESVNFGSNFDTSHVTTMGQMFWKTTGITSLDLSSFSSESLSTVGEMFTGNTNLQSVTLGNSFTLSDVTSMANMFNGCSSLESIDLSMVTFENVTTISNLFDGASALTNITLGQNINAEKLTDASSAFKGTSSLAELDLSSFHAPNLANMSDMFRTTGVKNLDLSSLGATSITNIHEAFWGIANLETIDISNLKLSGSQSPAGLFFNDSKLTTIYANYNTDFSSATSSTYGSATRLRGGAGTAPTNNPSYLRIDDPDNDKPGVFTLRNARYIRYNGNGADNATPYGTMTSEYLKAGDSLKKNAFTRSGYEFTGWKDADNNEYTDEQVMADLTESKTPLELYAQWDPASYTVTFNANGGEVLQSAKTVTYLQPYGELPTPVKYDYANSILGGKYSFKEWNTKADGNGDTITPSSVYENTDDITLYAIWNDQFTVTIYNGESETPTTASYGIDDIVYLNAQNVAGKQFLYWEVDGAKKSYLKDYSMRMFQGKDLTIRAVYGSESDLESQQPGTYISDIYRQYSDNRIVVRSYSYVPDGYEIVKAGVVATLDADIANGTFDDQTATYPRAASVNGSSDNYYYTWSKGSVTSEQTVYVKAYLIYKDADGVEHTIYGDLVTATLTE